MNIDRFATFESKIPDREELEQIADEKIETIGQMAQAIGLEMLRHTSKIYDTSIILKFWFVGDVVLEADTSNHRDFKRWHYSLECKEKPQIFSDNFKLADVLALAAQFSKGMHWIDDKVATWKKFGHNNFIKV